MKTNFKVIVSSIHLLFSFLLLNNSVLADSLSNITVHFSAMGPHLNQNLHLRVVDKGTMKETARTVHQITTTDFDIVIDAVTAGRSYFIDFFADHNNNGLYDAPPTDHTWRMELNNAVGSDEINFSHNTNFTDINWVYSLTVNFSGMSPHLGQQLELRVENNDNDSEVDRIKIPSIISPEFNLQIIGLKLNTEYKIEFYADHNGNGLYDSPPTDHTWEIDFTNTSGDVTQNFSHNTEFVDINWKYLLTVNFFSMSPHLGQPFFLRVVKQDNQEEIGRVTLPAILVPDFSIYIPEFELEHGYNIDFYADHNGNGTYDAPPGDHAWRLSFNSSTGDLVQEFTHNTNFTDIHWPNSTSVKLLENTTLMDYNLYQNYPNPFNPSTKIRFSLPAKDYVSLKIYNILGSEITTLINSEMDAGSYEFDFSSKGLTSGVYFYTLSTNNFTSTRKMILTK